MKSVIAHPVYGEIVYEESFWTGKKKISINGQALVKVGKGGKGIYAYQMGEEVKTVMVQGSYLFGTKLAIGSEIVPVSPAPKWYEIVISAAILIFLIVWGNASITAAIFPIVGGGLGGALAAAAGMGNLALSRFVPKWWQKLLVGIGVLAAAVLSGFLLALVIVFAVL